MLILLGSIFLCSIIILDTALNSLCFLLRLVLFLIIFSYFYHFANILLIIIVSIIYIGALIILLGYVCAIIVVPQGKNSDKFIWKTILLIIFLLILTIPFTEGHSTSTETLLGVDSLFIISINLFWILVVVMLMILLIMVNNNFSLHGRVREIGADI